jgi:hypothetical protein
MSATITRAQMLASKGNREAIQLADVFCRESRERIEASFRTLFGKHDKALNKLSQSVLRGDHAWLEQGIAEHAELASIAARTEPVSSTTSSREPAGV